MVIRQLHLQRFNHHSLFVKQELAITMSRYTLKHDSTVNHEQSSTSINIRQHQLFLAFLNLAFALTT